MTQQPRPHRHNVPTVTLHPVDVAVDSTGPLVSLWLDLGLPNQYRVVLAPELAVKAYRAIAPHLSARLVNEDQ
jgi:hypothetical protein